MIVGLIPMPSGTAHSGLVLPGKAVELIEKILPEYRMISEPPAVAFQPDNEQVIVLYLFDHVRDVGIGSHCFAQRVIELLQETGRDQEIPDLARQTTKDFL